MNNIHAELEQAQTTATASETAAPTLSTQLVHGIHPRLLSRVFERTRVSSPKEFPTDWLTGRVC